MSKKEIALLSGGLDSMLTAKKDSIKPCIQVVGVNFVTPFFGSQNAVKPARQLKIELYNSN
jgi:tRNA U34 2-thiouridine synthase MnmA/TrmU